MSPAVPFQKPVKITVEAGKDYWWCSCGYSANQPFCDGSHRGRGFAPKKFTPTESGDLWLCQCKHTANPPFCDGSHKSL